MVENMVNGTASMTVVASSTFVIVSSLALANKGKELLFWKEMASQVQLGR